ncbi:MAG: SWIM zinc finger family protein [Clostridiales bacterium]|jgi:uncharacterized Zn finger protein|nr:SWIM zinc finger family protein [Clostridiales bacterium]
MRGRYNNWGYPAYVSVGEKKAMAQRAIERLKKTRPDLSPVVIDGGKLAKTWWGSAWVKNLENYADFINRLGRGSSYVKNGMVIDLRIGEGRIDSLVMGSGREPYKIQITIDKMSDAKWKKLLVQCGQRIGSVVELADGKFPEDLRELFMGKDSGLFPSPNEIHMNCSCPDWSGLCKHLAAALYGVGARFDNDPLLFFKLRGIPFEELLVKAIDTRMRSMLNNAGKKSGRVLEEDDLSAIFGV